MEDQVAGRLDYKIRCNPGWETLSAEILGWAGGKKVDLRIIRSPDSAWLVDGRPVPGVEGCADLDLSFSPSTNLLPIRRLNLEIGQKAEVRAAWLKFPGMELQPLVQRFRRKSSRRYYYESDTGFSTELEVDPDGFVVNYPPFWIEEKGR